MEMKYPILVITISYKKIIYWNFCLHSLRLIFSSGGKYEENERSRDYRTWKT